MRVRVWAALLAVAVGASGCPRRSPQGLDPEPYLRYLRNKMGDLYGVAV